MNENNNGIAFIALTILGFAGIIAVIFTGKMIFEQTQERSKREIYINNQIEEKNSPIIAPAPIHPIQERPVVEKDCSKYHHNNLFWNGYKDGWDRVSPKSSSKEYLAGYEVGQGDRMKNCKDYLHNHCPPGLNIRVKGFNLNIK